MFDSKMFALLTALAMGSTLVSAHGHVMSWTIGGEDKPGFNPSNPPMYGQTAERPSDNSDQGFTDYTVGKVACGGASAGSGLDTWDVDAGSSVVATWDTWPDSHKGPVIEYMAACPSSGCDGVAADSLDWFKISETTGTGSQWASDTIVSTKKWSFDIPSEIASGNYLVRHEIIAMHTTGEPQVYPYCFQANVVGGGSVVPSDTVKFPAAYTMNDEFKTFSLYGGLGPADFTAPGPAVFNGAGGGGGAPAPAPTSAAPSTTESASASSAPTPTEAEPAPEPTDDAPIPEPTDDVPAPEPTEAEPAPEPTEDAPAPEPTDIESPAPVPTSTYEETQPEPTSAAEQTTTQQAPAPQPTGGNGQTELGGPAPAVTPNGDRWEVNGGSYHNEASAKYASCMFQMNKCKDWANSLPNAEVGAGFSSCDAQASSCTGAGQRRRDVLNRYNFGARKIVQGK